MDKFRCLRCLNDCIEVPDMIRLFASGTNASLMAKNRNRKLSQPFVDRYWCLSCLKNCIKVPNMIGSSASGAIASLVAHNITEIISAIWGGILMFKLSKWPYQSARHNRIATSASASLMAKNKTKKLALTHVNCTRE